MYRSQSSVTTSQTMSRTGYLLDCTVRLELDDTLAIALSRCKHLFPIRLIGVIR